MLKRKSATDRRQEIAQTALRLAFRFGPGRVTTGMIAAELGLTQPAIYRHFPRKQDIWAAVAQSLSHSITRNIALAQQGHQAPEARIRALVLGHLRLVADNPALPEFMVSHDTKQGREVVQNMVQAAMSGFRTALEGNVAAAIKTGRFRGNLDARDAEALIFGVIQSLVLRLMVTRNPDILAQDGERLLELQLAGFSTTGDD